MVAVTTNAGTFKADLDKFAKQVNLDVGLVRRKVATDLFALVQAPEKPTSDGVMVPGVKHPVDVGRARFGWAMSDGSPNAWLPPEGSSGSGPNTATFAKSFQITWIVNNVPYIGVLEFGGFPGDGPKTKEGFSTQSPGGWVRKAISLLEFSLNAIKREPK